MDAGTTSGLTPVAVAKNKESGQAYDRDTTELKSRKEEKSFSPK
jgi:hypothetical protein